MTLRRWMGIGAVLLLASGCASSASPNASAGNSAPIAPTDTPDPLAAVRHPISDLESHRLIRSVELGGEPDWQVFAAGALWVDTGHVVRIDAATNTGVTAINVPGPCFGMAAAFGSIWVPSCGSTAVERIDAKRNVVVKTISVASIPYHGEGQIVATDDAIWLSSERGLLRIDPRTDTATDVPLSGGTIAALVWSNGFLWGTRPTTDSVVQIDPAGKIVATIAVDATPRFEAAGEGAVWTLNQGRGDVSRIDPTTGKVVATVAVEVPGAGGCIAAGAGGVWVTMPDHPFSRIDPASNTVAEQYDGPGGDCIGVGAGSIWLSNNGDGSVWRIAPP
jgi:virginiamycin B lyase